MLLGPFEILATIGEGAFGVVYRARREGREVALKVMIARDEASSPTEIARFVAEAEKMRRVTHPSLVALEEAGTLPDGRPFLAMPLLGDRTLAAQLRARPYPADEAFALFTGIAGAVDALHHAGLIHRDIKPENVMVLRDRLVLLDLGIARELAAAPSTTTQAGMSRGTPAYMAPERLLGQPAAIASDVYELALLLCVMVLGRTPWTEGDAHGRFAPVLAGTAIPSAWAETLTDALALDPTRRPKAVRALVDALARTERVVVPVPTPSVMGLGTAPTELVPTDRVPGPDAPAVESGGDEPRVAELGAVAPTHSSHTTTTDARFVQAVAPPRAAPPSNARAIGAGLAGVALAAAAGASAYFLRVRDAAESSSGASAPVPTIARAPDPSAAASVVSAGVQAISSSSQPDATARVAPAASPATSGAPPARASSAGAPSSAPPPPPSVALSAPCQRFVALMCSTTSGARPEECTAWRAQASTWTRDLPPAVAAETCESAFTASSNGLALRRQSGMAPPP